MPGTFWQSKGLRWIRKPSSIVDVMDAADGVDPLEPASDLRITSPAGVGTPTLAEGMPTQKR